jgi:hypothetical protein
MNNRNVTDKEKKEDFREIEQILKLTEIKRQLDVFCEQMLTDIKHRLESTPPLLPSPHAKQNPDTIKKIKGMLAENEAQIKKLDTEMQNETGVNNLKL